MLTAFTNFVGAAYAADQATKANRRSAALQRPGAPTRRHTEHLEFLRKGALRDHLPANADPASADESTGVLEQTSIDPPPISLNKAPRRSSGRNSLDSGTGPLQTVLEGDACLAETSDSSHPPQVSATRRSSLLVRQELSEPHAPRLLPLQYLPEPSPLVIRQRSDSAGHTDYLSARPIPNASSKGEDPPPTPHSPRIGPTTLDLPPSPWTSLDTGDNQFYFLSLSRSSIPGTPRLAPTHLSVLPSPFPSAAPSPLGSPRSFLTHSPAPLKAGEGTGPLASPTFRPLDASPLVSSFDSGRRGSTASAKRRRGSRLTPANLLAASGHSSAIEYPKRVDRPADSPEVNGSADVSAASIDSQEPHLLWTVCAGIAGFVFFCLVHLVDLVYETASFLFMTFWFLRWLVLNLLGQTVLSRCIIDAYRLIRAEWSFVAAEDHEDKGHFSSKGEHVEGKSYPAGLSKWQVMRGVMELICLQAVTRERWVREGAGLREIKGWQKTGAPSDDPKSEESSDSEEEDSDLIITRRDADILEFTRTPRLRPRGGHSSGDESSGGYFAGVEPVGSKKTRKGRSFVKKLKWASRLAIGAYGLRVHIVDLPPTFTPSGNRFTRQTFAHITRLSNPDDVLHADIQQMTGDEYAYQPTFYVARDHVRKMIVVAVRGTQSFSDIIADLDMRTEKFPLPDNVDEAAQLTCHAGVLRAAQGLLKAESSLFSTVSKALEEHEDFGLTLVGHSLGAAIASAIAMLLGHYEVRDEPDGGSGAWQIRRDCGLPAGRPIQAISLASPATFSAALSARAAMGSVPLVTSVVLGADIIPRAGHGQARELRRVLGALSRVRRRLTEKQMKRRRSSVGVEVEGKTIKDDVSLSTFEDARVHVLRSWWTWRSLKKIPSGVITPSEAQQRDRIETQLWRLRCDVEADLYTAIKQRAAMHRDYHHHQSSTLNIPPSPRVGPQSSTPLHRLAERRQALDSATLQSEAALGGVLIPAGKCFHLEEHIDETAQDGSSRTTKLYEIESPASFFSLPEFVPSLFISHLPTSYEAVIEKM